MSAAIVQNTHPGVAQLSQNDLYLGLLCHGGSLRAAITDFCQPLQSPIQQVHLRRPNDGWMIAVVRFHFVDEWLDQIQQFEAEINPDACHAFTFGRLAGQELHKSTPGGAVEELPTCERGEDSEGILIFKTPQIRGEGPYQDQIWKWRGTEEILIDVMACVIKPCGIPVDQLYHQGAAGVRKLSSEGVGQALGAVALQQPIYVPLPLLNSHRRPSFFQYSPASDLNLISRTPQRHPHRTDSCDRGRPAGSFTRPKRGHAQQEDGSATTNPERNRTEHMWTRDYPSPELHSNPSLLNEILPCAREVRMGSNQTRQLGTRACC